MDYIAEHLNPKGKAGIIVPEGVIFQSGTAYKDLRKMLVDKYLYGVVSLPAGVFNPYSGVKTSILLFDLEIAKESSEILFINIENDGYSLGAQRTQVDGSQLEDAIRTIKEFKNSVLTKNEFKNSAITSTVKKSIIAQSGDYNLNGDRYSNRVENESSYPIVLLGDYIKINNGRVLKDFDSIKNIACIKVSDMNLPENQKYIVTTSHWLEDTKYDLLPVNSIIFPKRGAAIATNKKRFTKIPCLIDNNCMGISVVEENKLNPRYLFEFLQQFDLSSISNSAGIALINNPDIKGVKIPLPPLAIQNKIVDEIEKHQNTINDLYKKIDDKQLQIKNTIAQIWTK